MRPWPPISLIALLVAAVGLGACGDEPALESSAQRRSTPAADAKRVSDPALRGLERQASRLLGGGRAAFQKRLADLHGTPVVVNQWASWCPPCRAEFPIFQRLSEKYTGNVAFLGVDMQVGRDAALAFLSELPTQYPHYFDEDTAIARLFGGGRVSPTTGFYDAAGKLVFTHLGAYANDAQLESEIRRHAFG